MEQINEIEFYRNHPGLNQSTLKTLFYKPLNSSEKDSDELYFEEKKYFIIGSAVDCLLTEGHEEFSERYYISELENKYSDKVTSIIKEVFDTASNNLERLNLLELQPYILQACNNHQYLTNWKDETRINKIIEAKDYFDSLVEACNKTILSQQQYNTINSIVSSLLTNEFTREYFNQDERYSNIYQLPIYFDYMGVSCKALLDVIRIDHKEKTITPIDIKTLGDYTSNFFKSFKRNHYYIQAIFYTKALESYIKEHPVLKDYTIKNFKFIVESTLQQGEPSVFTLTDNLLKIAEFGRNYLVLEGKEWSNTNGLVTTKYGRIQPVEGLVQLINKYKWYMENSNMNCRKDYFDYKGHFDIDWDGIIK